MAKENNGTSFRLAKIVRFVQNLMAIFHNMKLYFKS